MLLDNLKGVLLEKDINFLNKLFEKNNNKALIPSLENILKDLNEKWKYYFDKWKSLKIIICSSKYCEFTKKQSYNIYF